MIDLSNNMAPGYALVAFHEVLADDLVAMWRASFEAAVGLVDPHSIGEQRAYLMEQVVPNNSVRVMMHGDRVAACIATTEDSVAQLYVSLDHQRRGLGTMLLNGAKAESNGSLCLYTFERNTGAQRFYERNGFVIVERGFEPQWQLADIKYRWMAPSA